jgi:hypothetical protein
VQSHTSEQSPTHLRLNFSSIATFSNLSDVIRVKVLGRGDYVESIEECNAIFRNISKSCLSSRVGEYCNISFASYTLLNSGKKSPTDGGSLFHYLSFPRGLCQSAKISSEE